MHVSAPSWGGPGGAGRCPVTRRWRFRRQEYAGHNRRAHTSGCVNAVPVIPARAPHTRRPATEMLPFSSSVHRGSVAVGRPSVPACACLPAGAYRSRSTRAGQLRTARRGSRSCRSLSRTPGCLLLCKSGDSARVTYGSANREAEMSPRLQRRPTFTNACTTPVYAVADVPEDASPCGRRHGRCQAPAW